MGAINYQKLVCWGDSQTVGARTFGCYPLHLATELQRTTRYLWAVSSLASNGFTVRDLWVRVTHEAPSLSDCYQACVLIGANDVAGSSDIALFRDYYAQLLVTLRVLGWRVVHCGEIPPIWPDGHAFVDRDAERRRENYNQQIRHVVEDCPIARFVQFEGFDAQCFVDPLHFSEQGNRLVARAFAESVRRF